MISVSLVCTLRPTYAPRSAFRDARDRSARTVTRASAAPGQTARSSPRESCGRCTSTSSTITRSMLSTAKRNVRGLQHRVRRHLRKIVAIQSDVRAFPPALPLRRCRASLSQSVAPAERLAAALRSTPGAWCRLSSPQFRAPAAASCGRFPTATSAETFQRCAWFRVILPFWPRTASNTLAQFWGSRTKLLMLDCVRVNPRVLRIGLSDKAFRHSRKTILFTIFCMALLIAPSVARAVRTAEFFSTAGVCSQIDRRCHQTETRGRSGRRPDARRLHRTNFSPNGPAASNAS